MKVTMLLADSAQAVTGKLYILGGGWSITGPDPIPCAIALKIEVPWTEANRRHKIRLVLLTADDQPVMVPTPAEGERALEIQGEFEVGRPTGLMAGTPLDAVVAINLPPIPIPPGGRYVWRLSINGESKDEWYVAFSTRAARSTPAS